MEHIMNKVNIVPEIERYWCTRKCDSTPKAKCISGRLYDSKYRPTSCSG